MIFLSNYVSIELVLFPRMTRLLRILPFLGESRRSCERQSSSPSEKSDQFPQRRFRRTSPATENSEISNNLIISKKSNASCTARLDSRSGNWAQFCSGDFLEQPRLVRILQLPWNLKILRTLRWWSSWSHLILSSNVDVSQNEFDYSELANFSEFYNFPVIESFWWRMIAKSPLKLNKFLQC